MLVRSSGGVRPLFVGGSAALFLALFGALLAQDFGHWWWHLGTIGSAIGITFLLSLASAAQKKVASRIFVSVTMTVIVTATLAYLLASFGVLQLQQLDQVTGGRSAIAAGVLFNTVCNLLILPQRRVIIGLVGIVALAAIGNIPMIILAVIGIPIVHIISNKTETQRPFSQWFGYAVVVLVGALLALGNFEGAVSPSGIDTPTGQQITASEKMQAYGVAIEGFLDKPFAGQGLGNFGMHYAAKYPDLRVVQHAHSSVLQVLFEQGSLGVLALVFLGAGVVADRKLDRGRVGILLAFLLALALFDATFYHALIFYSFWFTLGIIDANQSDSTSAQVVAVEPRSGTPHRYQKQAFRRAHVIADFAILVLGLAVLARLMPGDAGSIALQVWITGGLSAAVWLVLSSIRLQLPGSYRSDFQMVFVPPTTIILAIVIFGMWNIPARLPDLAVYFIVLQTGFLFSRLIFRQMIPKVSVLLIGKSKYREEFERDSHLLVETKSNDYGRFDFVIIGDGPEEDAETRKRMSEARVSTRAVLTDKQAVELFHGRVPPADIPANWERVMRARNKRYLPWKKFIDISVVIIFSPFIILAMLITALLVLISSGRPVIFSQLRVGKDNKPFRIYKFRTMRTDAERAGAQFAQTSDARVTPIGRILRGFRLDEIPQFYNVLRGEMSIIGPRPEQVDFAEEFEKNLPAYNLRHIVRPGITGWAQVNQGYAAGSEETHDKLTYDLFYISRLSIWMDLLVVVRTIVTILTKFGAK